MDVRRSTFAEGLPESLDDIAAARLSRALAHPVRIRILRILGGRGECYCGDLCAEFSLAQSTISQHLKVLREAGLVTATPCGTAVGYCVDVDRLNAFVRWTSTLSGATTLSGAAALSGATTLADTSSPFGGPSPAVRIPGSTLP